MPTARAPEKNPFVRHFALDEARRRADSARQPSPHQVKALRELKTWFDRPLGAETARGGLLVLPTGGGKTFTAVRFLCEWPLSEGYKVLWLAHTHHLLEQACETFGPASNATDAALEVSRIREPRESLRVRVVSGMPGHAKVQSITADDDVVIGSLQTIAGAHREDHASLLAFLRSARDKLVVVFDEAHHAPAPTYARFVEALRQKVPGLALIGLTATPVYESKLRRGWLGKLFPQGIVYQTTANQLMTAGVLARPVVEQCHTHVEAPFDDHTFARWSTSYADLPETIIDDLARNQARNDVVIKTYVDQRAKFGKTLIFADRWYQCDYIRTGLQKHGVKADVVYSHVDAKPGTVEARNRRTADDNTKVIRAFKAGELDVLINVRMLTEGTDVPSVQSVFLTRQTTSKVLLTQMVGCALRGPAFGGTDKAYVVSFIDDWKQLINWAEFSLEEGATASDAAEARAHVPAQLISIELVRRLSAQMYQTSGENTATFLQTLPVGWFRAQFDTQVDATGDIEHVERLVLVYDATRAGFEALQALQAKADLGAFVDPLVTLESQRATLDAWVAKCFPDRSVHLGGDLVADAFHLARHIAQSNEEKPQFFAFDERSKHDLDALAGEVYDRNVGYREIANIVQHEYARQDRFWRALYGNTDLFRLQFDAVLRRIENLRDRGAQPAIPLPASVVTHPESYPHDEPSEELKLAVKERDKWTCRCCGSTDKRHLQVDHVQARYHGGKNELANLQTLCRRCNGDKGVNTENFLRECTPMLRARAELESRLEPDRAGDREGWERSMRATLNAYFRCAAVSRVEIGGRGQRFYEWLIVLNPENDPRFLEPHLTRLLEKVRSKRSDGGVDGPNVLVVEGSDAGHKRWSTRVAVGEGVASKAL